MKSVENFSDHPYVFSLLNGMLWSFYGLLTLKKGGLMILTVNAIGCVFQYVYLAIYMAFSPIHKQMVSGACVGAVHLTFVGLVLVVKFCLKDASLQLHVMGACSSAASIVMFASPLSIMGVVICTKSVEYMPFLLSLSFFLRSSSWCAYGYVVHDIFIEITNTIGVSLGISQLFLYMIYQRVQLLFGAFLRGCLKIRVHWLLGLLPNGALHGDKVCSKPVGWQTCLSHHMPRWWPKIGGPPEILNLRPCNSELRKVQFKAASAMGSGHLNVPREGKEDKTVQAQASTVKEATTSNMDVEAAKQEDDEINKG
ncbi:hypothetical protein GOP47_0013237 [Adiantum capillus-veneris]|uniref:Bidirectional sugar transporter SWEET n=1 Tax=Adiantum capillus-veneris TaxID=13818 RepID=A0A9D4UNC1_ADICA|nr:hypothetical protein GOP47_0013237 [Adiantum capillus-veneris]